MITALRNQHTMIRCLIILISCFQSAFVSAFSSGASVSACSTIAPVGHVGSTLSLASSPFFLNVSQMTSAGGYSPGQTYTLLLTGGVQQYRGLMVQGRHGTTPVGSFSAGTLTQAICTGSNGVTHTSNVLKNNVPLMWTAPPKGTGEVVFSYAVVVQNSEGVSTFYATLTSPTIAELDDIVRNTSAATLTPARTNSETTLSPTLTLADTRKIAIASSAVSSVVVVILIGVTFIAIKVIIQRKMRVRESNTNHTAIPMNSLPSLSTTGHYHTTNGVLHSDQTLVPSAGTGAPIHTNTTADMPPPPYSSLPNQPTTCSPLGAYPAAPPAYPASECASV